MTRAERIRLGELHEECQRINAEAQARMRERAKLAKDVLMLAAIGGMPDSYWETDRRIGRACKALGWTRTKAYAWAQKAADKT